MLPFCTEFRESHDITCLRMRENKFIILVSLSTAEVFCALSQKRERIQFLISRLLYNLPK